MGWLNDYIIQLLPLCGFALGQYYLARVNKNRHITLTKGQQLFYYTAFLF